MKRVGRTGLGWGRCQNVLLLVVFSAISATPATIAKIWYWPQNKVLTLSKITTYRWTYMQSDGPPPLGDEDWQ